jgi:hypothetical protein
VAFQLGCLFHAPPQQVEAGNMGSQQRAGLHPQGFQRCLALLYLFAH